MKVRVHLKVLHFNWILILQGNKPIDFADFTCHSGGYNFTDTCGNVKFCKCDKNDSQGCLSTSSELFVCDYESKNTTDEGAITKANEICCNLHENFQNASKHDNPTSTIKYSTSRPTPTSTTRAPRVTSSLKPTLSPTSGSSPIPHKGYFSLLVAAYFWPTTLIHGLGAGLTALNAGENAEKVGIIKKLQQNKELKAGNCGQNIVSNIGRCPSGEDMTRQCAILAGLKRPDSPKNGNCVKPVIKGTKYWCQILDKNKLDVFDACCSKKGGGHAVWTCSWAIVTTPT